jgi:hypothetical protein
MFREEDVRAMKAHDERKPVTARDARRDRAVRYQPVAM